VGIETVQGTKSSQYQLIANDALEYFLLINDNTVADSTNSPKGICKRRLSFIPE
jgi:hypothetical protein